MSRSQETTRRAPDFLYRDIVIPPVDKERDCRSDPEEFMLGGKVRRYRSKVGNSFWILLECYVTESRGGGWIIWTRKSMQNACLHWTSQGRGAGTHLPKGGQGIAAPRRRRCKRALRPNIGSIELTSLRTSCQFSWRIKVYTFGIPHSTQKNKFSFQTFHSYLWAHLTFQ